MRDDLERDADIGVTDRGMIWNTDLIETLEFDNLHRAGDRSPSTAPPTARRAAARMPARTSPSATTRTG